MAEHPPPRLLLIEDDPDTAGLIQESLRDFFAADCVRHCLSLSAALEVDVNQFDLVLSDMNLPDGNGLQALQMFLERRPDLPFVLVTAETSIDTAVNAIRLGAYDYVVKAGDFLFAIPLIVEKNLAIWRTKQENVRLHEELKHTLEEVRVKNRQLEEAVQMLQTMATTDGLTGLANRRAFNEALDRCFAEAMRYGHDLGCLMIDLDGFKQVNDTLGHLHGDELLTSLGRVLAETCRRSDVAGRYGGDEFIVLLPQTDLPTAKLVSHRIESRFNEMIAARREQLGVAAGPRVSLSMGLACLRHSQPTGSEQLIAHADHALYAAKQAGKNRLQVFNPPATAAGDIRAKAPAAAGRLP